MKIINLDKFKATQAVQLEGQTYSVRGLTLAEYLEGTIEKKIEAAGNDTKTIVMTMLDILTTMTDIPEFVLRAQPIELLSALMQVCQGIDPRPETAGAGIEREAEEPEKN